MVDLPQEQLRLLTLTTAIRSFSRHFVYQGILNSAPMRVADVFRLGLADNAAALILAHNHL
ncbi:MAG: DNA repair protein RadC, partial [Ardenticatenia bacterium]|nr:DNA repair protein RadC [Ardenticatenia bacterium]